MKHLKIGCDLLSIIVLLNIVNTQLENKSKAKML